MKPYSNDLRQRVIDAYYNAEGSLRKLAVRFSVSLNFVWLLLERFRETGRVDPKPHGGGQPPKIQGEDLETLQRLVEQHNNATVAELHDLFVRHAGYRVSPSTISRALKRLRITRKKIDYHASERDQDPKIAKARAAFRRQQRRTKVLDHWIFVDECGVNLSLARRYGRAVIGQRVPGAKPAKRGPNFSVIGAMNPAGVTGALVVQGAVDAAVFETFVEQVLAPTLGPGDRAWLDNLSAHQGAGIEALITARGAELKNLPPYSPDLSPIELCWSAFKEKLRKAAARSFKALIKAVKEALESVTPEQARAWFRYCGFCIEPG
jgi:transposase